TGGPPIDRIARNAIRVALSVAILGFAPWAVEPFHEFKAVILRAVGLAALAWGSAEAWARRLQRPGWLALAAAGWVAVTGLATLLSVSPRLSLVGEMSQREGFLTVLALAGLHISAAHAHREARQVRATLAIALVCGALAAIYAQLQIA